jgi:hypothetical protein
MSAPLPFFFPGISARDENQERFDISPGLKYS